MVIYGTPVCPGDLDEDGSVGFTDLLMLLMAFASEEGDPAFEPAADFDNSRMIDVSDVMEFLKHYNQTCS